MKKLLTPVLAALAAVFLFPQAAEARGCNSSHGYTYVSGRTSCGCKIYTKRVVSYYDCHGHPVYRYYRQPIVHHCHRTHGHYHRRTYRSSNGNYRVSSSYRSPRYSYRSSRSSCGNRRQWNYVHY